MLGFVDVGGGSRGAYGAGVLDRCLERGIDFDLCVGVSAGSANAVSYMAGQHGRNLSFYAEYALRREYMSLGNLRRSGNYLDLDYIYGVLSNAGGENPLDYPAMLRSGKELCVVATDARTGLPHYFSLADFAQDDYAPLKASSCVPIADRPYEVDGRPFFDGGLSNPIPVVKALELGCDKVVVILTRPRDHYRDAKSDLRLAHLLDRRWPNAAALLRIRAELYNSQLDLAKRLEKEGKVLIVAPASTEGIGTLTKDRTQITRLYEQARADANAIEDFIS